MLVVRLVGEGYVLIDEKHREEVIEHIRELWDTIFEEARWGSIDQAIKLYSRLFERVDKVGRKVKEFSYGADIVLPPRNLNAEELKDLLVKRGR